MLYEFVHDEQYIGENRSIDKLQKKLNHTQHNFKQENLNARE